MVEPKAAATAAWMESLLAATSEIHLADTKVLHSVESWADLLATRRAAAMAGEKAALTDSPSAGCLAACLVECLAVPRGLQTAAKSVGLSAGNSAVSLAVLMADYSAEKTAAPRDSSRAAKKAV